MKTFIGSLVGLGVGAFFLIRSLIVAKKSGDAADAQRLKDQADNQLGHYPESPADTLKK